MGRGTCALLATACALLCLQACIVRGETDCQINDPWRCGGCNEDGVTCMVCQPGMGFDTYRNCRLCTDPLCNKCHPQHICWECKQSEDSQFPIYLDSAGKCQECTAFPKAAGCVECNRAGQCSKCSEGHRLVDGRCQKCKGGPDCTMCGDDLRCRQCKPFKGLNYEGACVPCDGSLGLCENCQEDFRTCQRCSDMLGALPYPQYMHTGGKPLCRVCPIPGCSACGPDGTTCERCADGFGRQEDGCVKCEVKDCLRCDSSKWGCDACPEGTWYDRSIKKCRPCMRNCERCADRDTCLECKTDTYPSYGLVRGRCVACEDVFCARCDRDPATCRACKDSLPFGLDPADGRCKLGFVPQPAEADAGVAAAAGPRRPAGKRKVGAGGLKGGKKRAGRRSKKGHRARKAGRRG